MKALFLAVCAAALALAAPAGAADWAPLTFDPDNEFFVGVDGSSLRTEPGGRRVGQLIFAYRTARTGGGVTYDYLVREIEVDCAARTHGLRRTRVYRLRTREPLVDQPLSPVEFLPAAEGSIAWDVVQAMCGAKPLPATTTHDVDEFAEAGRSVLQTQYEAAH